MEFDAERAHADMQALAFPRRTGTPGAEAACDFIVTRLRALGLEPAVEAFTYSPWLLALVVPAFAGVIASLVLAATLAYPASPTRALVLILLGVVVSMQATRWSHQVERLLDWGPQQESANVVAAVHTPATATQHVVLMAHYDSKSQWLPLAVRAAAATGAGSGGTLVFGASLLATLFGSSSVPGPDTLVVGAGIACAAAMVLAGCNPSGNRSPGALDNAAGVAVMLEVARAIPHLQLQRTRVTVVATGAEEEGLAGAVRFFQAHQSGLGKNVLVVNLDCPGASPEVAILTAFGVPPMGRARRLLRQMNSIAQEAAIPARAVHVLAGIGADHFPAALRGIPAITVGSLGPALARIHTPGDTPDGVRAVGLAHAGRLVLGLLRAIDQPGDPQQ